MAGVRDSARRAVRAELREVAWALFLERGYDATTMEEIADRAGLSRRSLFRYVTSKEEVVLAGMTEGGELIAEALRTRSPDEPAWDALRAALMSIAADFARPDDLERTRLVLETASLRASHADKQLRWQDLLAPLLADRLGSEARARALVASVIGCLHVTLEEWVRSGGAIDLETTFDDLARAVRS